MSLSNADIEPLGALDLPEIVHLILEQLVPDRKALWSAAQVNKLWANKSLSILWRRPPHKALEEVQDDARRQYYARWIDDIIANNGINCEVLAPWAPYLRPNRLKVSEDILSFDGTVFELLFQSRLSSLQCSAAAFVAETALRLITESPRLAEVILVGDVNYSTTPSLVHFLETLRKIKRLRSLHFITTENFYICLWDTLFHLSEVKALEHLTLGFVSSRCLSYVLERNTRPFYGVNDLSISVYSTAVPWLKRLFQNLTLTLDLRVLDDAYLDIEDLVSWSRLQKFRLSLQYNSKWGNITKIGELTELRSLRLIGGNAWWFTDGHLQGLLRCLPHLRVFEFCLGNSLSTCAFIIVGQHCPQLKVLHLDCDCDFRALFGYTERVFPQLKFLACYISWWVVAFLLPSTLFTDGPAVSAAWTSFRGRVLLGLLTKRRPSYGLISILQWHAPNARIEPRPDREIQGTPVG
jgi:hypothetical protein